MNDSSRDRDLVDLSVIIVSWNVRELLDKCLESLQLDAYSNAPDQADFSMEVIVVDSGSMRTAAWSCCAKNTRTWRYWRKVKTLASRGATISV